MQRPLGPYFVRADLAFAACKCNLSVTPLMAVCIYGAKALLPALTDRNQLVTGTPGKSGETGNTGVS